MSPQHQSCLNKTLAIVIAVVSLQATNSDAFGAEPFPIVIPVSREATRAVLRIESSMATNDAEAIEVPWNKLLSRDANELVAVSPDHFMKVSLARDILKSRMRDELKRQLGFAINPENRTASALTSADKLWLRGNIQAARIQWLRQLPNRSALEPDWRIQPVDGEAVTLIAARLTLADSLDQRPHSAARQLELHRDLLDAKQGPLAGQNGNWGTILDGILTQRTATQTTIDYPRLQRVLWSAELPERSSTPASIPTVHDQTVIVPVDGGVRALAIKSGKSRWPYDETDNGDLFHEPIPVSHTGSKHDEELPLATMQKFHDTAMHGTTIHGTTIHGALSGDLWIGRIGPHWRRPPSEVARSARSQVLAFDLAAEGRIAWRFQPASMNRFATMNADIPNDLQEDKNTTINNDNENWIVTGTPIVVGDLCVVPCRSAGLPPRLQLACLDVTNGEIVSIIPSGIAIAPRSESAVIGNDMLTAHGNNVYWNVDGAALIAVDLETTTLQWLRRLDAQQFANSNSATNENAAAFTETDATTVPWNQQIFTTSHGTISAIDQHSGALNWRTELHDPTAQLVGVQDHVIVIAGQFLWGLREDDGHILWRTGFVDHPPRTSATMIDGSILWLNEAELWSVNPIDGDVLQRVALSTIVPQEKRTLSLPIKVAATSGMVFLSHPHRLTAISLFASQAE